jgi:anaerobic magnesium-protoporphyrin IX monomethyl ester cyclase
LRNNFFSLSEKIAIPLLGTRGCPYSCFNYCTYPLQQGRKVRARSVKNIIDEIKYWKKTLGTSKFVFRDPVFSINKKHTVEFCQEVIKEKLNIKFMVETHLNNLDDEMINLLSLAGLELVYVGVESASNLVLKDMKRFTIEHDEQYKIIKKCEESGIKVKTMFIIGNPEDTVDTIMQTI